MISSIPVSNFTPVQGTGAPQAASAPKDVEFSYNSQDSFVMAPGSTTISNVELTSSGPVTERVTMPTTVLKPNDEGEFVFDQKIDAEKFNAACSMATIEKTIQTFQQGMGMDIPWAFDDQRIVLFPDADVDLNAYYSRDEASLNFFHDTVNGVTHYTGSSGEVVSHEVGHAMLDGLRPGYLTSWKADTNGFHEAFADTTAMLMATQDDSFCEFFAKQTGGDFSKPNALAAVGEELGNAINEIYKPVKDTVTGGDYIRCSQNNYKWKDPSTVPEKPDRNDPDPDPLTTEMHSWARIWTGAQYDMLGDMVKSKMEGGMSCAEALKSAGSDCIKLYGAMIRRSPEYNATYRQMAQAMLKADAQEMGGANHDAIVKAFQNRNILFEGDGDPKANMSAVPQQLVKKEVTVTLGNDCGMFAGAEVSGTIERDPHMMYAKSESSELAADLKTLINQGSILYTEPNQQISKKDLFDKNGNPYIGVVRWTDGKMVIERNKMIG